MPLRPSRRLSRTASGAARIAAALALLPGLAAPLLAQDAPQGTQQGAQQPPAQAPQIPPEAQRALDRAAQTEEQRAVREQELEKLQEQLRLSEEARNRIREEVEALRADRAKLNAALIETTERTQAAEARASAIEQRLTTLNASESAIRKSLENRREVIVEVLAALQRMGRRPPPAVLASPDDMLEAVRSSILLGAVLPELRGETEALATDLGELVRLKDAIASDREALVRDLATLAGERERLAALVAARQEDLAKAERTEADESRKTSELAARAQSLGDLIQKMESEIAAAQRAAEEARQAAEAQAREMRERLAAAPFGDPARLAPKIPFAEARGLLPMPVNGSTLRRFGAPDGFGGTTKGMSIATRNGAVVSAPSDGWVAFAGPFRSFGQLLIINAGGGYYILLAGMERITVALGQFVLAGEPVAAMGETATPLSTAFAGTNGPVLYVEFRKDGGSIDPGPWWAKSQGEKVRG